MPLVGGFDAAVVDDVEDEEAGDERNEANALVAFDADDETDGAEEPKRGGWLEAGGLEVVAEGVAELEPKAGVVDVPKPVKVLSFGADDVAGCK